MIVTDLGVFRVKDRDNNLILDNSFSLQDREIWLAGIQYVKDYKVGDSNYFSDWIENYNIILYINSGKGTGKSHGFPTYYYILNIEIATWCRPDSVIRKELKEGLSKYPIIDLDTLLDAFSFRDYYVESNKVKINYEDSIK